MSTNRFWMRYLVFWGLAFATRAIKEPIAHRKISPLARMDSSPSSSSFELPSKIWANNQNEFPTTVVVAALLVRGGGDIALSDEQEEPNRLLAKVRNIIRNLLQFGDKRAPPVSKILRSCCKFFENLTGVQLLPAKKSKKKTASTKKKKKEATTEETKIESDEDNDDSVDDDETAGKTDVKAASNKKKSSKATTAALKKPSATTQKHLGSSIKSSNPNYRIQRELKEFIKSPPPNLSVQVGSNIRVWIITMVGANNTIYEGEVFKLRVSFPKQYPTVPPSVYFLQGYIPVHEHVYTNGDICLSLLGKDWRPTMTAQSIAVSILSILSSAQSKSLPMDNARHAGSKPGEFQKDWIYHDDNC